MNNSPTSGSARRLARKQGLARLSALTVGAGAAGVLGAVAIGAALPHSNAASTVKTASAATTSHPSESSSAASSSMKSSSTKSSSAGSSTVQPHAAPSTTNNAPVATSGGS